MTPRISFGLCFYAIVILWNATANVLSKFAMYRARQQCYQAVKGIF